MWRACLDAQGHAVTRAGTGDRGMQYALEHDYAAIIVDRMLPVMDGLSVVEGAAQPWQADARS